MAVLLLLLSKISMSAFVNAMFRWLGKYSLELFVIHLYLGSMLKVILYVSSLRNVIISCLQSSFFCITILNNTK